jgi:hypothetical protein
MIERNVMLMSVTEPIKWRPVVGKIAIQGISLSQPACRPAVERKKKKII